MKNKRVKNKKNVALLHKLKLIVAICVVILICEVGFISYLLFFKDKESIYFDGINAVVSSENYYASVGSNNDNDNFYEKAKISKYDKNKEKTFEKLYNVGYNGAYFGVAVDGDSLVAVGSYEKTKKDHNDSIRRALIVKYDQDGNIEFEKDFKILDNSKFTSIVKIDGGYLVAGQSVYKNTHVGSKNGGAILVRYDEDGNVLWSKTYGSSKSGIYNDLLVFNDYIYVVGNDDNNLGIICKYDMDGNLHEFNDYKSIDDTGFSGIVNIGNRIYVCGANRVSSHDTDAMIVEYDLNCNYQRQVVYKGMGMARYNKLVCDEHDNLIVIGTMMVNRNNKSKAVSDFNYDGMIGKYSSDLEEIEVVPYGDERDDFFTDINISDNTYLVGGYSSYEDGSYLSKFISYSSALKVLGVE